MKNALSIIMLMFSAIGFSQIRIAIEEESNDTSGYRLEYLTNIALSNAHLFDFRIHNESEEDHEWKITRKVISQPEGWTNYVCWGPCYPSNADIEWTSNSVPVESGAYEKLSIYINAGFSGTSLCRYYVSTDGINYLDSIDIQVIQTVGLADNEMEGRITFFPNPTFDAIQITLPVSGVYDIQVYNLQGNIVMDMRLNEIVSIVDLSSVSPGNYFILFIDEEGNQDVEQLIIQK